MEKVKLTPEQAEAIEFAKKKHPKVDIVKAYVKYNNWSLVDELESLNSLGFDELIKALYIGYEVESGFKVGDWVKITFKLHGGYKSIRKITKEKESHALGHDVCYELDGQGVYFENEIAHATPSEIAEEKERRFFAKHGRKPWELKAGDLLKDRLTSEVVQVREVKDNRAVIGNYTAYENRDYIKKCYLVTCFAESRLDQ